MSDMDLGVPGALTHRQRRRFNELWSQGWNRPLSADQIRHPVWSRFLADPVVEIGSGDGLLARTVRSNRVISIDQSRIGLQQTLPSAWFLASVPTLPLACPEGLYHRLRIHEPPTIDNLALWDSEHERRYSEEGLGRHGARFRLEG